jgi:putative tricarboxylic transport membrane protein
MKWIGPEKIKLRLGVAGALLMSAVIAAAILPDSSRAETKWPEKPIQLVVHVGPGGATDIFARTLAHAAEPILGQPVVVVNRTGGTGAVQMNALKSAAPDGYTIGVHTLSHFTAMLTNLKGTFAPKDFSWICLNQFDPHVIMVRQDSPYKTIKDFVDAVKKKGSEMTVGGYGSPGTVSHIGMQMFATAAGLKMNWVAYNSTPEAMSAMLGEHVEVAIANPGPVLQFAEAGRIRVLAVLGNERIAGFPDAPTLQEAGFNVDGSWQNLRGFYGPAGIPEDIQNKIADAFAKAMEAPDYVAYEKEAGLIRKFMPPAEYHEFVKKLNGLAENGLKDAGLLK